MNFHGRQPAYRDKCEKIAKNAGIWILVLHWKLPCLSLSPLPSTRQHPSYGDCLEVKREYY